MMRTWFKRASWTSRLRFVFLSLAAYPIGFFCFCEFATGVNQLTWPVKDGRVAARTETKRWLVLPAARLSIVLDDDGATVHAIVAGTERERIPERVRVHYSGQSDREVRVVGEESPWLGLLAAVMLWLCPLVVLWIAGRWPAFDMG